MVQEVVKVLVAEDKCKILKNFLEDFFFATKIFIIKQYFIMNINELKQFVDKRVDEELENEGKIKDALLGLGAAGAMAFTALNSGDGSLDNRYQQASQNYKYTEEAYQKWCQDHELNPDDAYVLDQYNEVIGNDLQESKSRYIRRMMLVENMVRKELKRQLREREKKIMKRKSIIRG